VSRAAFWLLALFVASIPSENGVPVQGLGSLSRVLGMLAFAATLSTLVQAGRFRLRKPSAFLALALVFAFWSGLNYFWSEVPSATIGKNITLAQLVVMVWMVWQLCRTRRDTVMLMQAFVLGCYLNLAVGISAFFISDSRFYRDVGGLNPNAFSIVSALGIPMAWYLGCYWRRGFLTWLNFLFPAIAMLGVVLAASRGGLLTTLLALTVIPLTSRSLGSLRRVLLFALLALASWAAFAYAPRIYPELERNLERLAGTAAELESGTLTGRRTIWQVGYELFRSKPMLGIGFGAFPSASMGALGEPKGMHNAYFAVAVERGLVALILFAGMLITVVVSVVRVDAGERMFFLVLLAALLLSMVPTNSENEKFSWFLLALLSAQRPIVLARAGDSVARARLDAGVGEVVRALPR
jgi:O-antigen ligase